MVLLMVQKSGVHQLREREFISLFTGFIHPNGGCFGFLNHQHIFSHLNGVLSAFVDCPCSRATPTFHLAHHQSPTLLSSDDHGEWHPVKPALLEYEKWDDGMMEWWNGGKFTAEVVI